MTSPALLVLAAFTSSPQDSSVVLRYKLAPGDHLLYTQTLLETRDNRQSYGVEEPQPRPASRTSETGVEAEWAVHIGVLAQQRGGFVLGIGRQRTSERITHYRIGGEDVLAERGPSLLAQAAPEELRAFAHGMRITPTGVEQLPTRLEREWSSKALWSLSEFPALPEQAVAIGDRWRGPGLGFSYTAERWDDLGGDRCLRVEGTLTESLFLDRTQAPGDTVRHRFWFCPELGLAKRIEFEGAYPGAIFQKIEQQIRWEFAERVHGEAPTVWLDSRELGLATVAALEISDSLIVTADALLPRLESDDPAIQRRVLALIHQQDLRLTPFATLLALSEHPDPRVRTLGVRLLERVSTDSARPIIEQAMRDEDAFVRDAARWWTRKRTPPADRFAPSDTAVGWDRLAERSYVLPPPAGPVCGEPTFVRQAIEARDTGWDRPGTTLRGMQAETHRGWPYAVRLPDDYRGDQPFPVVFYLAGNSGPMLEGFQLANSAFASTGYIVVYPQGLSGWWAPRPVEAFEALYTEVMQRFNVDPDRVYLTGLSNGGTGTYFLSTLWPHRFTAAVSAMGGGQFGPYYLRYQHPAGSNVANLPMLFLHGERDQTILPDATRETVALLEPRYAPLETHFFPERGHGIVIGRGDEGMTLDFFERFVGRSPPRQIHFTASHLYFPRHYWVELLAKTEGAEHLAEVVGEFGRDGVVRLTVTNVGQLKLLLSRELLSTHETLNVSVNGQTVFNGPISFDCTLYKTTYRQRGDPHLAYGAELIIDVP